MMDVGDENISFDGCCGEGFSNINKNNNKMIVTSFAFFLLIFVAIGVLSTIKSKQTNVDYLLAGHSIKPWLVALSAIATSNSGYMFIGMIGYTYAVGLSSIWLMVGWVFGDFLTSFFVHKNLRIATEKRKVMSFAGALSSWNGTNYKKLRIICGIITILFLGTYAAAQLKAGSKALHVIFGWDYSVGAIIGAIMVLLYCFAGGIRASIWTDAAQSFVMIIAMALLFFISIYAVGGYENFILKLENVSPHYFEILPYDASDSLFKWRPIIFIIGWFFAGFGVIGQPHIMVRFMSMNNPKNINRVRVYYYSWYVAFFALTIGVGLATRLLIPEVNNFDPELVLPSLAQMLLPEILVGLILAGLFAATMSTADSQILSCSASLSHDFSSKKQSYMMTKVGTLGITLLALFIALSGSKNVFALVLIAWSFLGSAFAPLLMIYAFGGKVSERLAILTVLSGVGAMMLWKFFNLENVMYEIAPGIIAGFVPYLLWKVGVRKG